MFTRSGCTAVMSALLLAGCSSSETNGPPPPSNEVVAVKLAFTVQPAGAKPGVPFTTQPVVEARDAAGQVATTFSGSVLVFLSALGGSGTLCCTVTVNAVRGVATYTDLRISTTGTYIVRASSGTLAATSAAALDVAP